MNQSYLASSYYETSWREFIVKYKELPHHFTSDGRMEKVERWWMVNGSCYYLEGFFCLRLYSAAVNAKHNVTTMLY